MIATLGREKQVPRISMTQIVVVTRQMDFADQHAGSRPENCSSRRGQGFGSDFVTRSLIFR